VSTLHESVDWSSELAVERRQPGFPTSRNDLFDRSSLDATGIDIQSSKTTKSACSSHAHAYKRDTNTLMPVTAPAMCVNPGGCPCLARDEHEQHKGLVPVVAGLSERLAKKSVAHEILLHI